MLHAARKGDPSVQVLERKPDRYTHIYRNKENKIRKGNLEKMRLFQNKTPFKGKLEIKGDFVRSIYNSKCELFKHKEAKTTQSSVFHSFSTPKAHF